MSRHGRTSPADKIYSASAMPFSAAKAIAGVIESSAALMSKNFINRKALNPVTFCRLYSNIT